MTAILVALSILALVPAIFFWPHLGVLAWTWIGVMNPHRWAWGQWELLGFAQLIGMATLIAWVVSREPKRIPLAPVTVLLGTFLLWVTLTTLTAHVPQSAWGSWNQSFKIILMTFVAIALINTRERLHALIWVVVISLGYYGVKGGLFTFLTGGEARVWGPEKSFIGSNNQLALALIMVLPLIVYLRAHSQNAYVRMALLGAAVACFFSIIGSQSRGAFLALCVMGLFLIWKSRQRAVMAVGVTVSVLIGAMFVPDSWVERMETIQNYEEDGSAQGRFKAWTFAYRVAMDKPITGGGFDVFLDEQYFIRLVPEANHSTNFHSVYFEVLGEQGVIGLALFMALFAAGWFTFGRVMALTKGRADLLWAHDLARMSQVSMIGYATAGAFLNLAFYDLYYLILAFAVIVRTLVAQVRSEGPARGRRRHAAPEAEPALARPPTQPPPLRPSAAPRGRV